MAKMAGNGFPAPWLNSRPIYAPNKIDMIIWYSETDGYYPDATEHDSSNSVLRFFRSQGSILFNDEFHSENTIYHDDSQTAGRVNRVFRAIEMISKYKAAYEDGADLSKSIIRGFEVVWYDHEENELPLELMHNLRHVEDELKNRSPENSPIGAFWMGQEIQRSKWASTGPNTYHLHQGHPPATDDPTNTTGPVYYYDQNPGQLSRVPINQEHGFTDPVMPVTAYYPQNEAQQSSGRFDQEIAPAKINSQDHRKPLTALNPTTAAFVLGPPNTSPPAVTPEESTQEPCRPGPSNSSSEPTVPKTGKRVAELVAEGQKAYNWQERDDEYWPSDHIFIPTFCRPIRPWSMSQLLGPRWVAPTPNLADNPGPPPGSNPDPEASKESDDSGYASGSPPSVPNGDEENDADDEMSEGEGQQHSERGTVIENEQFAVDLRYPAEYRVLRIKMERQENLRRREEAEALGALEGACWLEKVSACLVG